MFIYIYIYKYKLFFLTSSPATVDIVDICKSNSCRLSFTHTHILEIYWIFIGCVMSNTHHLSQQFLQYNNDERAPLTMVFTS